MVVVMMMYLGDMYRESVCDGDHCDVEHAMHELYIEISC